MTPPFFLTPHRVQVIGMSGKMRSGKDWLTDHGILQHGFLPLPLANHFKVSVAAKDALRVDDQTVPVDIKQLWETGKDLAHRTGLQQEGTELGRNVYGEAIWVRAAEAWMYYFALKGITKFVITDVRFPNEVEWVRSLGGKVYRVTGRGGATDPTAEHISEKALDNFVGFDRIFDNSVANEGRVLSQLAAALFEDFGVAPVPPTPTPEEGRCVA